MTNKHEEQVPGVTLWFKHSSFGKAQSDEKFRVDLTLDCSVHNEDLWKAVEEKFKSGFRVFTSEDFHIEVMDVMRQEVQRQEGQLRALQRELTQEKDARVRAEAELVKYKEPLAAFGQALRGG